MKRMLAFLMTLVYLGFVTGQVWSCCEERNESLSSTFSEASLFNTDRFSVPGSHNFSKEDCQKISKHPSATKIKVSRFNSDAVAFKTFAFDSFNGNDYRTVSSSNRFSHTTPLFIRNRVLRI